MSSSNFNEMNGLNITQTHHGNTKYTAQDHQGVVNAIISSLTAPDQPTTVSLQYSNDKNMATEIQAYAKLSGPNWTYYVKDLEVSIGRNTEPLNNPLQENTDGVKTPYRVNIDLGPAKVVSRKHAIIKYNMNIGGWELHVLGRNGAKVNFQRTHNGPNNPPIRLSSGTLLDIGGTQMMFILPDSDPVIAPTCIEHLMPNLINMYGLDGNNNALLRDIIKQSNYAKQTQLTSNQQIKGFKLYGSGTSDPFGNGANMGPNEQGFFNNSNNSKANNSCFTSANESYADKAAPANNINQQTVSPQCPSNTIIAANFVDSYKSANAYPQALDFTSDLSHDENRNVKPPHSYATMITQAILSSAEGVISLADIYKYISSNYAYYRFAKSGWQNSIRHNLSLNKAFEKVPRRPNEPGKGMKWRISESYQQEFLSKWNTGKVGKIRRGSSVARQLQLHMAKFNTLPMEMDYRLSQPPKRQLQSHNVLEIANSNIIEGFVPHIPPQANLPPPQQSQPPAQPPQSQRQEIQFTFTDSQNRNIALARPINTPQLQTSNSNSNPNCKSNPNDLNGYKESLHPPVISISQMNRQSPNNALVSFTNACATSKIINSNSDSNNNPPANNSSNRKINLPAISTSSPDENSNLEPTTTASSGNSNLEHPSVTTTSSLAPNNLHLSQPYDTLLRSPTKAFHITAMEAYTPERGSANRTKSPLHSNNNNSNNNNGTNHSNLQTNGMENKQMGPVLESNVLKNMESNNDNRRLTPSTSKSQNVKSSPGVWNLLQFSSVNNTPATNSGSNKKGSSTNQDTKTIDNENALSEKSSDTNSNDLETKDVNSSPLKNQGSGAANAKELILDTDGAKISIMNN
ncbi:Fkh2p [Saccharomyces cerevisiae x Saccharomyces kudriavzevii VIN7]|uniref:Fkh2p n=1 Tax=Saccharomyces cerevisiae x Saccharomyces kudriavzevii (strain VIN7) TaxID=1095631 RepID=H0H0A9_SACCK|nr:Fkh2p [Saccharomyces cerevisiae x Saccharomyces kudriavzevii VIN7]